MQTELEREIDGDNYLLLINIVHEAEGASAITVQWRPDDEPPEAHIAIATKTTSGIQVSLW